MNAAPPLQGVEVRRVLVPFALVTVIWGSTWLVIRDQLGDVPAIWSISYRFVLASIAMFAFAAWKRVPLRLPPRDLAFAATIGLLQFVANFNLVYAAEGHVTSGLVAVVFGLLVVPNAILGRVFLRQSLSRPFLGGSAVALAGVALLFGHEVARGTGRDAITGIALTLAAVMVCSVSNVMQASRRAAAIPVASLLAWMLGFGAAFDCLLAWSFAGPPPVVTDPRYLAGVAYLGLAGSTLAFPLYSGVIRAIGPARAAYSSVLVPIIAMALSRLFEHYAWSLQAASGAMLTLVGLVVALRARNPAR